MRLTLDETFDIETDEHNFVLVRKSVAQSGKRAGQETRTPIAYAGRLDHALDLYAKRAMRASLADGVSEIIAELKRIDAAIARVGKGRAA